MAIDGSVALKSLAGIELRLLSVRTPQDPGTFVIFSFLSKRTAPGGRGPDRPDY